MKLLLDENLSDKIVRKIIDLYPNSAHVKKFALKNTDDGIIWEYAIKNDFAIVSKDADFINAVYFTVIHLSSSIFGLEIAPRQK